MMNEEGSDYTVTELTEVAGISRQAYYQWLQRPTDKRKQEEEEILALILELEEKHLNCLGSDKMTRLINRNGRLGYTVNHKRVERIMREHGIRADYRQPRRNVIKELAEYDAQNILNRQFDQTEKNRVWVTDTTELTYGHQKSKVRLHVVLDLYGQYPVSWLITPTETADGAICVFQQALEQEGSIAPLVHTDRGSAYTSRAFNEFLAANHVQHSLSAPGTPADNAVIEHWWADFKSIWIAHTQRAQTLGQLEELVRGGIAYFTDEFISAKRNDLTAAEFRFGKAS